MNASRGIGCAVLAALLWSGMGLLVFRGFQAGQEVSSLAATLIRVLVNFAAVLFMQFAVRRERRLPWGDAGLDLWIWGLLGALTITTFLASLRELGSGEATLLQGVQGVVIAALAPLFLKQRPGPYAWIAICGGLWGISLILGRSSGPQPHWGARSLALASGLSAGAAYLLLSRSRARHHPDTISFYWCLMSLLVTGGLVLYSNTRIPFHGPALPWLVSAGIVGSIAQWLTTIAYKAAPAALVASTSYLVPLFSIAWEVVAEGKAVDSRMGLGCALVLVSGMALPFLRSSLQESPNK
jgi:S-adenosylmethionine uptake transporter